MVQVCLGPSFADCWVYFNLLCLKPDLVSNFEGIKVYGVAPYPSAYAVYLSVRLPQHLYGGVRKC